MPTDREKWDISKICDKTRNRDRNPGGERGNVNSHKEKDPNQPHCDERKRLIVLKYCSPAEKKDSTHGNIYCEKPHPAVYEVERKCVTSHKDREFHPVYEEERCVSSLKDHPAYEEERKCVTSHKDHPAYEEERKCGTSHKDRPAYEEERKCVTSHKDRPVYEEERKCVTSHKDRPAYEEERKCVTSHKDRPAYEEERKCVTSHKDRPVYEEERKCVTSHKDRPVYEEERKCGTSHKDKEFHHIYEKGKGDVCPCCVREHQTMHEGAKNVHHRRLGVTGNRDELHAPHLEDAVDFCKQTNQDFVEECGPRQRHTNHDKNWPGVTIIHDTMKKYLLRPKRGPGQPRVPPVDFLLDKAHPEYGAHEPEDRESKLRSTLCPLEDSLTKLKRKSNECQESLTKFPSEEPCGYPPCPREEEPLSDQPCSRSIPCQEPRGSERFLGQTPCRTQTQYWKSDCRLGDEEPRRPKYLRRKPESSVRVCANKSQNYTTLKDEEEDEENFIPRHGSVLLPVLEDSERIFHDLVAAGDIEATAVFLDEHPNFNINCVNYQKISALHVAVKEQNEAMVEFLLRQNNIDISDCALYAIKGGNFRIIEMILDKIREKSPRLEFAGTTHSVDFPDDLTPIVLAAQLGNYEIIDLLIKRGHCIPPVHPPLCRCECCKADLKRYDRLRYSSMKLNLYKAICNPMYIFHTTDDPFQRAFELVKELQDAATVFPQFKVSFEELQRDLKKFTTDLIGCCRNAQEVEIVLKKSPRCVADHIKFPRLQYAIDLKQKEFVSHPYTQAVLSDAWTGELREWKVSSPLMQSLAVLPRIPMLPIITAMCILLPGHCLVRRWKTPVNRMISSVASYIIFLIIIFLESNLDKKHQKRGPPNSGLEGLIILYVLGYIWLNTRTCFKQGIRRYFSIMWHWYDTIMLFLFAMTIIFWIASWVDITANDDIDLPRKYWNALDPELIAEGFFACAVIMAFFRLNLFLSLNYHLGPLQVSIGKMMVDIFRFIIIFCIIILAWCAGLCRFYQPYEGMVQRDAATGNTITQVPSFVSFLMTLKTFFWAIFGMSPIESADVVIENLPGDTPDTTIINKHQFTEAVGYIAFALFQFLSVVVVLNMLVACMASTFTKVIDNATVEWVFGRSQIYLSFMASSVLPPPFNLIPTACGLRDMCRWCRLLAKPCDGQRARCNLTHCCFIESETEPYVNNEFPLLMSELAQRYISQRDKAKKAKEEKNSLCEEVRAEICEMKELLRKLSCRR